MLTLTLAQTEAYTGQTRHTVPSRFSETVADGKGLTKSRPHDRTVWKTAQPDCTLFVAAVAF